MRLGETPDKRRFASKTVRKGRIIGGRIDLHGSIIGFVRVRESGGFTATARLRALRLPLK
jgi:hypothetical protein